MPTSYIAPKTKEEADPRRWLAMGFLLLASFMNLLDVTIVNVALPAMQTNLGATSSQIEWVSAAYVLAFAVCLLPFGRLGDIVGRKKMFIIGVSGFTIGSALCGIAPSIETLIVARVLQGIAGAAMTPQVLAIVQVIFPPQEKGGAFALFGLTAGLASVAGPLVGGALISADLWSLDWRPIFLVNIPFGILAAVAGGLFITHTPANKALKNDFLGMGIFGLAIVLMVFPLVEGRVYGWAWWTFAMMIASIVVAYGFYNWQQYRDRNGHSQLLAVGLLRNRNFLIGTGMTMIFFSGVPGLFLVLAIFLQSGFGLSPLESGLTTMPFPLGVLIASAISGRLGTRFLSQRVAAGSILLAIGMLYLHFVFGAVGDSIDHWQFVPPLLVAGIGLGVGIAGLFQTILTGVPPRDAGSASGALQAFQQVGSALGIALVGHIFFSTLETAREWGATSQHDAFVGAAANATYYEIAVFVIVALMVPLLKAAPRQAGQGATAEPVVIEV